MTTFLVGEKHTRIMLHTDLVAAQSSALNTLVNGPTEEADTRAVKWDNINEETFAMLAQYMYTGEYNPSPYKIVEEMAPAPATLPEARSLTVPVAKDTEEIIYLSSEELSIEWDAWQFGASKKTSKGKRGYSAAPPPAVKPVSFADFASLSYPPPSSTAAWTPRPNVSESEDYTPVFLSHAHLFAVADLYDIPPLRALALYKLHATLVVHTPYEARYSDIITLARYAYANTADRQPPDPLRNLITHYVASQKRIAASKTCRELVLEGGAFAGDLLALMLERVN
jgi:hypothetical protein